MATVCLHIGAMKSGTSYLQHILSTNKDLLLDHDVLFPGARWRDQVAAAEDAVGVYPKGKRATPGAWDALANEVRQFSGATSIISMETLATADTAAAQRVVESFPEHRVRVVVTARDLARVVPAQWQETIKNGAPLRLDKFLALISAPGARTMPGARAFWGPQDLGRILRTWQPFVSPDDLVLVTVPPKGAARDLLWQRFCQAADLPNVDANLSVLANESLGEASTELLRQLNRRAKKRDLSWEVTSVLKHGVAKQILASRTEHEAAIVVPEAFHGWTAKAADELVADVVSVGPVVIGSLDELRVTQWHNQGGGRLQSLRGRLPIGSHAPASDEEVLDAALDAILGLSQQLSSPQRKGRPGKKNT